MRVVIFLFFAAFLAAGCAQDKDSPGTDNGAQVTENDVAAGDTTDAPEAEDAVVGDVLVEEDAAVGDAAAATADMGGSDVSAGTDNGEIPRLPGAMCQPSDLEKVNPGLTLTVPDEHRTCATVDDCAAIYINCSACGGGCTGVHGTCAEAYKNLLKCDVYDGPVCDYDCHPQANLTTLQCVEGLCTVVE